ncbi:MAG: hypothetical protein KF713_09400 [Turneriella sp.]|nr:hypothetical protein [Turneriella sp.]
MAKVEDLYRKIRRGDTRDIKLMAINQNDLAEGVERIRARLAGNSASPVAVPQPKPWYRPAAWHWVSAAAAALVAGIVLWPRPQMAPFATMHPAGTVWTHGAVEVRVVRDALVKNHRSDGKLYIELRNGIIAVKRKNPSIGLEVKTPDGKLVAMGTVFLVEYASRTSVKLIEGKLVWQSTSGETTIDAGHPQLGRDLGPEAAALPPEYRVIATQKKITEIMPGGFRKGECVIYYRNNEKRRGKIYAREGSDYIIHGAAGPEPGAFHEGDFFRGRCDD